MFDIDFSWLSINSMGARYGCSKLFQILIPLASYLLLRDLLLNGLLNGIVLRQLSLDRLFQVFPETRLFRWIRTRGEELFSPAIGLVSWKIGCDLGFFLVVTGLGPWSRAFTWSGLIPYGIIQYFIYYLIGRRMLVEGRLNPFGSAPPKGRSEQRPPLWRRIVSKFLHEDLNATNEDTPLRQVLMKPFLDYGALVLSWSMYNVGIFFAQSGEVNFDPVVRFGFFQMGAFYLVNTYGFVIGFNIGEWLHFRFAWLEEQFSQWNRKQSSAGASNPIAGGINSAYNALTNLWREVRYTFLWRIEFILKRYGMNRRWLFATVGGVYAVALLAPGFSGFLFSLGNRVSYSWFSTTAQLSEVQIAQVSPSTPQFASLPDSEIVISEFPQIWQTLYSPTAIARDNPKDDPRDDDSAPEIASAKGLQLSSRDLLPYR